MKLASVRYLAKEGVKNTWANRLMTIASVGVLVACMVIIGLALLISENIKLALGNLEKQNVVMAYMKDYSWAYYGDHEEAEGTENTESTETTENAEQPDENGIRQSDYLIHNEEEANALCEKIAKLDNVEKVEFVSSEQGLESVKQNMEDKEGYFSFLDDKYGNPLSGAAKVTMKDMKYFDKTIEEISKFEEVDAIQSQGDLADKISAIKQGVKIAGIGIVSILLLISLMIVSNTIRITMDSRKLEISIMKAVGATDAFVRIPFIAEGMIIGLVSALISEGVVYFCYRVATEKICSTLETTNIIAFSSQALKLFGIFAAIGVVAGAIGSFIIIGKYLRKEGSEFAAI